MCEGGDQPSVTGIRRNVKIRTNAAEWCRIKDLKRKHAMLVISRLQPITTLKVIVVGVLCEIQDGVHYMPSRVQYIL